VFKKWHGNPWAILLTLSLGFFMTLLDLTIVNIAIPDLGEDLNASLDEILWVVNAYTLALAVLLITGGRLGDLRGKRNLFAAGVALFTLASLACGLAQDPAQLIAFRAVQGLGAALLMPQTLSIIAEVFPADRRGVAMGIWGAVAGVSGALGPILGGALITHLSWRWIFFVNLPFGALVLIMTAAIIPGTRRTVRHRFDTLGVLLASAALFCLAFGLTEGQRYDWNRWIWSLFTLAAVLFAGFLLHERGQQSKDPLVPFSLFRDRNFTLINLVGVTVAFGIVGMYLPLTIYLQSVLGFSALKSGLVLLPVALGSFVMAGPAGVLADKIGGKFILMGGLLAWAGGLIWVVTVADVGSGWLTIALPLFLIGLGAGCTFAPFATEVMRGVPARLAGAASGVTNALRQVGSVLAGAVVGAVLQNQLASALTERHAKRRAAPGRVPRLLRLGLLQGRIRRQRPAAGRRAERGAARRRRPHARPRRTGLRPRLRRRDGPRRVRVRSRAAGRRARLSRRTAPPRPVGQSARPARVRAGTGRSRLMTDTGRNPMTDNRGKSIDFTAMYASHDAFRRDLERLAETVADGRAEAPGVRAGWENFKRQLHIHHTAEDSDLWPRVRERVAGRPRDLALLDDMEAEHSRIDPLLAAVDAALTDRAAELPDLVRALRATLDDHLKHEEDSALPLIQDVLTAADWGAFTGRIRETQGLRGASLFVPWIIDGAPPADRAAFLAAMPPPVRVLNRLFWQGSYRRRGLWARG
jgi:EmrB/QacA subfamily drug resistance transporter